MGTEITERGGRGISSCGVATILLFASLAFAKSYDIIVDTANLKAEPVVQSSPIVPDTADLKKHQEGWVRVGFDVSTKGKPTDAVVIDSVGGEVFEAAALTAIQSWSFVPDTHIVDDNIVSVKFKNGNREEKLSRSFMRWYNMAARELMDGDLSDARERIELAKAQPDWNLYERSLLEVLDSEISGAENNTPLQLAALRRVIHIDNASALNARSQRKLLKSIFELELQDHQFESAFETLVRLRDVDGSETLLESLADDIAQLESALGKSETASIGDAHVERVADEGSS